MIYPVPIVLERDSVRLEPMSEDEFRRSVERAIVRHAADSAHRGIWTEDRAAEASREEFHQLLPNGRDTPGWYFATIVASNRGSAVGESWYSVREQGGKPRFWIDWLWIDPEHRGMGYATATLLQLEHVGRGVGADRAWLMVLVDNPVASRLYSKLGYQAFSTRMMKPLAGSDPSTPPS